MVNNFHKFSINEKDRPSEGGSSMRRGKMPIDQDSPSKSGIEYKKNMTYQKADTGISSANSYKAFIEEAVGAIDEMTTIVSLGNPELAKYANGEKVNLGSALKATVESHKKLWEGLSKLAEEIIKEKPTNRSVDEISKIYQEQLAALEKQIESGEVTAEKADQARADLKKDAQDKVDLAQNIYFKKMSQALPYFKEAIDAFKEGAILEITNVDNEEAKADNIKSESNYTNYLEQATNSAIRILYKNKS
jgi:hypothetical protein